MRPISVDVANELSDIADEVDLLARGAELYFAQRSAADPAWNWLAVQGLASGIEKVYSGCERVMAMIASEVDGARIER